MDTKRKVLFCSFRRISDEYSCPEIVEATFVDPARMSTFTARTISWDVPAVVDYLNDAGSGCDETVLLVDQHCGMDWVLHQLMTKCNNLKIAAFHDEAKGRFCPQLQSVSLEKFADSRAPVVPCVSWKTHETSPSTPENPMPALGHSPVPEPKQKERESSRNYTPTTQGPA